MPVEKTEWDKIFFSSEDTTVSLMEVWQLSESLSGIKSRSTIYLICPKTTIFKKTVRLSKKCCVLEIMCIINHWRKGNKKASRQVCKITRRIKQLALTQSCLDILFSILHFCQKPFQELQASVRMSPQKREPCNKVNPHILQYCFNFNIQSTSYFCISEGCSGANLA